MNKKTTLPPDGAKGIETIEDILAMSEDEKRELLRLWKERQKPPKSAVVRQECAPKSRG